MDSIRNEEHNWKQNYAWFTIQRERERNLEAKFDRKPHRTRNSSRVHRSWRELRRFERCGVFMAGHKNGRANGGWDGASLATGCRHVSLARIHPKFLFSVRKKKKRDGGRREWKKNGRGRREDALGVWGKGWERKGEGGNDAIKTMASSGRRRRTESSVIVGRKIANNRGRGGWGGEIRSERVGKI